MSGKCKYDMAHNSKKINDVEKMFWGDTQIYILQKLILDHINEMSSYGGRELICHAISLHPLSMRNMCRQKICENINMKTDIALSICRCV